MDKKVVDFNAFRRQKESEKEISRGRLPLHVSHLDGKITGSPHLKKKESEEFGARMERIKSSLERINQLMSDLKKTSKSEDFRD